MAASLAACGEDEAPATNTDGTLNTIDMTFTISSSSLAHQLVFAARDGGFFDKYKINANIVTAESSAVAMAALVSGSAQVAFVGRSEGVTATASGQKMVYIYKHSTGFISNVTVSKKFADAHPGCVRFAVRRNGAVFLGATPERLLSVHGLHVSSEALAGSHATDAAALLASGKERGEHDLVVEAIAATLAPIAYGVDHRVRGDGRERPGARAEEVVGDVAERRVVLPAAGGCLARRVELHDL